MRIVIKFIAFLSFLMFSTSALAANISSHRIAVDELLKAMNIDQTMMATIEKMVELEIQNNPELIPFKDVLRSFFQKHMTGEILHDSLTEMYMEEFSEDEINAITSFYRTPVGKKAIQKLPILSQKGAMWGQNQVKNNLDELKAMVEEEAVRLEEMKAENDK